MERYVDGFVIPLPKNKLDEYKRIAERAGAIWKEHGALEYWECLGDDLDIKDMVSFRKAAGTNEGETVVFSWIVYESREHRDKVNAAVMADPRIGEMMKEGAEPIDCKRMVYGGFKKLVQM
ncbi:MAG: RNA signal recognition particle 4.5S RNA [Desulfobulbaceae bacterium BRH_c16a]|nr:MAG: RNA signal recognition particle 4.5S RNA [Desulfobulbaceae bacterium BRH_c16a]